MGIVKFVLRFFRTGLETGAGIFSNLGATEIDRGNAQMAAVYISLAAVFTSAKATVEHYLSPAEQRDAETALTALVRKHKGLRPALEAIAAGTEVSQHFSPAKAAELLALANIPDADAEAVESRQEELLLHIGQWLEKWCLDHQQTFQTFREQFDTFALDIRAALGAMDQKLDAAVQRDEEGHAATQRQVSSEVADLKAHMTQIAAGMMGPGLAAEVERATGYVKKRQYDVAIELLEELRKRPGLSREQRFQVLKHLGHAVANGRGDYAACARFYLEAKDCLPDSDDGLGLEAIAELNLGSKERADQLATALLARSPGSKLGLTAKIRAAPETTSFDSLEQLVPEDLRKDADVAAALAFRAWFHDDLATAEKYASLARDAVPDGPTYVGALGRIILDSERQKATAGPEGSLRVHNPARVEQAASLLTRALELIGRAGNVDFISQLRVDRGVAFTMLGRREEAEADFTVALVEAPRNPEALLQRALVQRDREDLNGAIASLRASLQQAETKKNVLLLAHLLNDRRAPGDVTEAIAVLQSALPSLKEADEWLRNSSVDTLVRLLAESGKHDEALVALEETTDTLSAAAHAGLRALAMRLAGKPDQAKEEALRAAASVTDATPREVLHAVSIELEKAGLTHEAFKLLRQVASPTDVSHSTRAFLKLASKCGEDREVLDFCRALRGNGHFDPVCIEIELQTLWKYNALSAAQQALDDFLNSFSDEGLKKRARVLFSVIGLSLGRLDLIERNLEKLPSVETVDAHVGEAVAHILGAAGDGDAEVRYAYALLRRFPAEKQALRAMIRAMLPGPDEEPEHPPPETVDAQSAVCIEEEGEPDQWRIIEDDAPDATRGEISSQSDLARQLLGHPVGAQVVLRRGGLQERIGRIKAILHRTVRRFHEALKTWDDLYPDDPFILRISLRKDPEGNPDFSPIFRSVDQREQRLQEMERLCRQHNLPVTMFARLTGDSVIDAFQYICEYRALSVRTCVGTDEERADALAKLKAANGIVLTPSAIAVIYLTGLYRQIEQFPVEVLVSTGTVAEIRRLHYESMIRSTKGGAMAKIEGQYTYIPASPEEVRRRQEGLRDLLQWLRNVAIEVDGLAVLDLPLDKVEAVLEPMGQSWVEAVAIAKQRNYVLWEEEANIGLAAVQEFGIGRIWGQAVVQFISEPMPDIWETWDSFACELLRLHFIFTSIRRHTVQYAGEQASWDPRAHPLGAVLKYITRPEIGVRWQIILWATLMRSVWNTLPIVDARRITETTLKNFEGTYRPSMARGIIHAYLESVLLIFPDDFTSAMRLWIVLYEWLFLRIDGPGEPHAS